jgi:hypothetical protein
MLGGSDGSGRTRRGTKTGTGARSRVDLSAGFEPTGSGDSALAVVGQIMQVIELGSPVAGEGYVQAQQHALTASDRVGRDLLEDLLARCGVLPRTERAMPYAEATVPLTAPPA